jgi:hypothetical protein
MENAMTNTNFLIESERTFPSNVVPLYPAGNQSRGLGARPYRSSGAQVHPIEANAVEQEPAEQRLARRVERVLCALLYHAVLGPGDPRDSISFSVEKRVNQLVARERLAAIARGAINLELTADLTRLAAAAIMFELQTQSRWRNKWLRLFSARRRQINTDTLAIAGLLAWDMDALTVRPIDTFAKFL